MHKLIEKFLNLSTSDKINIYRSGLANIDSSNRLLNIIDNKKWFYYSIELDSFKPNSENYEFIDLADLKDSLEESLNNIPYYYKFKSSNFILENQDNILITHMGPNNGGLYISPCSNFAVGYYIYRDEEYDNTFHFSCTKYGVDSLKEFIRTNLEKCEIINDLEINLLKQDSHGNYKLTSHPIKPIVNLNIEDNYNDEFVDIHNTLYKNILSKDKSFNILHGLPGTGKTTYIKYLSYLLAKKGKEVVYLPPSITNILSTPHFIDCLAMFKNKVVIIEDAEGILIKSGERSQAISNILNITDGILSDVYNIHFIFTFNMDIRQIDEALLRKGRLTLKYEFRELSDDKISKLSEKLGIKISNSKTLAEIYNTESTGAEVINSKIGF